MLTRIFGRLTAWQNWIFQRPNAVGEKGALKVYGKGEKAAFDWSASDACLCRAALGEPDAAQPRFLHGIPGD